MLGFDLSSKKALVTGGSRGIGLSIARGLAEARADVVVSSRNGEACSTAAAQIATATGRRAAGIACDVARDDEVTKLFAAIEEQGMGPLDIVVTCAGVAELTPSIELERAQFQRMLDIHLLGSFDVARRGAAQMQGRGGGAILFCSSIWGLGAQRMAAAYGAAKAGLCSLTRTLCVEWAPLGIRVNAIAPGLVETDMTAPLLEYPQMRERMVKSAPMRRTATPDEMIGAAVFLCSPAASYVTGHVLVIDGGVMAR